jgi:PAS domain S-box-containing protein
MQKGATIFTRIQQLLGSPAFEDEEKIRLSHLLHSFSMTCLAALIFALFVIPFTVDNPLLFLVTVCLGIPAQLGVLVLLHRRHLRLASLLLASASWAIITIVSLEMGGITGPMVGAYVIVILMAGLLLGGRAGMSFAALSVVGALGMFFAESSRILPWTILSIKPVSAWITCATIFSVAAGLLWQATRSLGNALERARRNEHGLAKSNRELQASHVSLKQRCRDLFEEAPVMYVITRDQEGVPLIADCNLLFLSALGYTRPEVVGKPLSDFYTPASRAVSLEGACQQVLSDLSTTEERELVTRDGRVVLTLLRAVSETDAEGRVIGTRAMFTDITGRQQAEKALAQERNLLLTLVHNAPDPIYVKDIENRFMICNMALARQMGAATPDELVGKTDFDFHPQEMAVQYYADERILFQSGRPLLNHKELILDRAGNPRWVLTTKVPLQDIQGQIIGLVGMSHDITDLVRTEEALGRQAARLALLNEVGGKIASVLELESVLSTAARLVQERFGYHHVGLFTVDREQGKLVMRARAGQFAHLFPAVHRIELEQGMVGWTGSHGERLLANDVRAEPRYINFYPDLIPNQSELCVPIRVGHETVGVLDVQSPQLNAFDQNDVRVMEILADQIAVAIENARLYEAVRRELAERKQAEERLQHYSAELAQSNEELKQFTYTISHDLRAPLVNLKGFSGELSYALEVLRSALHDILPQLDEEHRSAVIGALLADVPEALGFIDASVSRMDHYINALLKLSRLGRRELVLERVDMEALVKTTVETLAYQIEQRRARVTVGPLPAVVADRTLMEQVMGHILNNAILYLEAGRPGEIEITGERNGDETIFRVRDNGRGIAPEDMDKVFAPFRRAGKQDVPGEGMGLAYVQTLVRRHGGRIWCESGLGMGTMFTLTVPHQLTQGGRHV